MLETSLARVDHGHPGLVARLDRFEIPIRATRLDDRRHPFAYPYVHSVTEREKSRPTPCRARQCRPSGAPLRGRSPRGPRVFPARQYRRLETSQARRSASLRYALSRAISATPTRSCSPGADAHSGTVLHVDHRVAGDARFHQPAEQQVVQLLPVGVPLDCVLPALPRGLRPGENHRHRGFSGGTRSARRCRRR